jgi:hypothetical protein
MPAGGERTGEWSADNLPPQRGQYVEDTEHTDRQRSAGHRAEVPVQVPASGASRLARWLARRIAVDHVRAALIRPTELGDQWLEDRPQADDDIERLIDAAEVRAALAALPPRMREIFIEVHLRGRTVPRRPTCSGYRPAP